MKTVRVPARLDRAAPRSKIYEPKFANEVVRDLARTYAPDHVRRDAGSRCQQKKRTLKCSQKSRPSVRRCVSLSLSLCLRAYGGAFAHTRGTPAPDSDTLLVYELSLFWATRRDSGLKLRFSLKPRVGWEYRVGVW